MNEIFRSIECYLKQMACNTSDEQIIIQLQQIITLLQQLNTKGAACETPLFTEVCNQIDLSPTETSLTEIITALQAVNDSLDNLEVTTENINIEAGQINLNTDQLEALMTTVRDILLASQIACGDEGSLPLNVNVCNSDSGVQYNNFVSLQVIGTTPESLLANTYHAIAVIVIKGPVAILVDATPLTQLPDGFSYSIQADGLINIPFSVVGQAVDSKFILTTNN